MLKKLVWLLAGLAFVAGVIAPPLIGLAAERHWSRLTDPLAEQLPGYIVITESWDRGWFRSEIRVRLVETDPAAARLIFDEPSNQPFADQPAWSGDIVLGHGFWPVVRSQSRRWLPAWLGGRLRPAIDAGEDFLRWPESIHFEITPTGKFLVNGELSATELARLVILNGYENFATEGGRFSGELSNDSVAGELSIDAPRIYVDGSELAAKRIWIYKHAEREDDLWQTRLEFSADDVALPENETLSARSRMTFANVPGDISDWNAPDFDYLDKVLARWFVAGGRIEIESLIIDFQDEQLNANGWAGAETKNLPGRGEPDLLSVSAGEFDMQLPVNMARQLVRLADNPQAGAALAALKRNGDQYELALSLADGVLTVNGVEYAP